MKHNLPCDARPARKTAPRPRCTTASAWKALGKADRGFFFSPKNRPTSLLAPDGERGDGNLLPERGLRVAASPRKKKCWGAAVSGRAFALCVEVGPWARVVPKINYGVVKGTVTPEAWQARRCLREWEHKPFPAAPKPSLERQDPVRPQPSPAQQSLGAKSRLSLLWGRCRPHPSPQNPPWPLPRARDVPVQAAAVSAGTRSQRCLRFGNNNAALCAPLERIA